MDPSLLNSKDPIHLWAGQFCGDGFPFREGQRLAAAGLECLLLTAQPVLQHVLLCWVSRRGRDARSCNVIV